jgi:hypothetical protein
MIGSTIDGNSPKSAPVQHAMGDKEKASAMPR